MLREKAKEIELRVQPNSEISGLNITPIENRAPALKNRIINEDESLFLRMVEEGKGDLSKIYRAITKQGELTDDISLLKVAYTKKERNRTVINPEETQLLILAAKKLKKEKKFDEAITRLEKACLLDTANPRLLKELLFFIL